MDKKIKKTIKTEEALKYVVSFFEEKKIKTEKEDWILLRKYKNINNQTCRDFLYSAKSRWYGLRCVVVYDETKGQIIILENITYSYFARQAPNWIVFDYSPFFVANQMVIVFKLKSEFKQAQINEREFLEERFNELELSGTFVKQENGLVFYEFSDKGVDDLCEKLQKDRFDISDSLGKEVSKIHPSYLRLNVDVEYFNYNVEISDGLNYRQAMDYILNIITRGFQLRKYEIGLIKKLVEKIPKTELSVFSKIVFDFDFDFKPLVAEIFKTIENQESLKTCPYFLK